MRSFKKHFPIRLKLLVAFGLLWVLVVFGVVAPTLLGPAAALDIGIGTILLSGIACIYFREAIAQPYVATVVRMEALAAGDLASLIEFTSYTDCVGRMTKAMFAFKEAAIAKAAADAARAAVEEAMTMVVDTLGTALAELSKHDLTGRLVADYPSHYGVLKTHYNDTLDSVRSTVQQVSESARAINTGAHEIAQASDDLARRTQSNAASLEETSDALVQIEERLKATATASQRTVARADQAMTTVDSGRSTAETAMLAMGRVSGSAKGIDDVIEGLDKIAFQTRVLAMNAAVEAGRAGDAGRGFAVVADLVSALAMRAEEEAKRARNQLSVTQSEIVTAVEAVGKVDSALAAISTDVGEVNNLLAGMASDNQAQSAAVTEITAAVGSMDKTTQQNAAMVEQTSAAARNLMQEVSTLASNAAQFRFERRARDVQVEVDRRQSGARPGSAADRTSPAAQRAIAAPTAPASTHFGRHSRAEALAGEWSDF